MPSHTQKIIGNQVYNTITSAILVLNCFYLHSGLELPTHCLFSFGFSLVSAFNKCNKLQAIHQVLFNKIQKQKAKYSSVWI